MGASLYEPINLCKPTAPGTASSSSLFECSPSAEFECDAVLCPMDGAAPGEWRSCWTSEWLSLRLAAALQSVGTIRHLISAHQWHYATEGSFISRRRFCANSGCVGVCAKMQLAQEHSLC
jgi:hypothetical protein